MKKNNLIKVILLSVLITVTVISSMAQNSGSGLSFGAKAGIASSGFTHFGEVFTLKKEGIALGAFAEFKLNGPFGASAELNYVQQGAFHLNPYYIYTPSEIYIYGGNNYIGMDYSDVKLHTLDIPVLFNFRPVEDGNITPKLSLGFAFDFIIKAHSKNSFYEYTSTTSPTTYATLPNREPEDVSSRFKAFNCGPVGAVGIDFKSKGYTYFIEARYFIGLNHINNLNQLNNVTANSSRFAFSVNTIVVSFGVSLQ